MSDGLSEIEAAARLKMCGPNELPSSRPRGFGAILWGIFREPMFFLLAACTALYFILGDLGEAVLLLFSMLVVTGITYYQEKRTENALYALRQLSSPRALVLREGSQRRIAGRDVVPGDLILIKEGDRVPADGQLVSGSHLSVDESLLTGESVPVSKFTDEDANARLYSGTLVVGGDGIALVLATGPSTELGKIGNRLQTIDEGKTHLQQETSKIVRVAATIGILVCISVVVIYGTVRGNWLQGTLAGLTTAMSLLPEEFPVVLTIFLAMGAWRISKKHVLTRRVSAIENLGTTTILCVDKTGTLTENRMFLQSLRTRDHEMKLARELQSLPEEFHILEEYAVLASHKDPFDPMEKAIRESALAGLADTEHLHDDWELVQEYPLSARLLAMSCVWMSPDGIDYCIAAKGAPEAVIDLCHLEQNERQHWERLIQEMADQGLRLLGVARARFSKKTLPVDQHDFNFEFVGLLGLLDPIRPEVPQAIRECEQAGIRVMMITGDYPGTARHIAREIGLQDFDKIMTGEEMEKMDEATLRTKIQLVSIVARAVPDQKLRVVRSLQASGHVVAMTGDGVNDGPSLKAADIGIAMGGRGTDVAREAADLVLLDDNFASIVTAVRSGRRIFDNLKKAMAYLVAVHVPIAGMSLIPILLGFPMALLPVHIVFLELIIDPASSLVFEGEPEDGDVMQRPPRNPHRPFFNRRVLTLSLLQGGITLAVVMAVFWFFMAVGRGDGVARAAAFISLIVANLGLILTNRSLAQPIFHTTHTRNTTLWVLVGLVGLLLMLIFLIPGLRHLFGFNLISMKDSLMSLLVGLFSIFLFEILKKYLIGPP